MALAPGDTLGPYEIVAPLRKGGMATLYVARRTGAAGFAKHVAIKVVHSHLALDQTFVRMLIDEALMAVRIQHPNVVQIEELGEHEGQHFIAMEYVHGTSLARLLEGLAAKDRRMSPKLAVYIGMQAAEGLHAAHEAKGVDGEPLGLVHRDVSPQNILVSHDGHVKVIDFGIAKARGRAVKTTAGTLKGKFRYMSPEQAKGKTLDRRTDVYALAIVLWEMLTTRRLFDAKDEVELLQSVRDPAHAPPGELVPGIPGALDDALTAALSTDPEDRPVTALELRRSLVQALPEAATLDSAALATLVVSTAGDTLDASLNALPEEQSKLLRQAMPTPADDVVDALTLETVV